MAKSGKPADGKDTGTGYDPDAIQTIQTINQITQDIVTIFS